MNPRTFALDRFLMILVALALLLGGAWLAVWALDRLPAGWWSPTRFTVGVPPSVTEASWWPLALLLGGLGLVLLGLWWLASHFRSDGVGALSLPGSQARIGRLTMDAGALASGAAAALARNPGVTGAKGRVVEERNRVVMALTATVSPEADLRAVARACDDVAAHVLRSSGRQDLACRIRVRVTPRARTGPRVR